MLNASSEAPPQYPVHIYAFDSNDKCAGYQKLTSDAENMYLKLPVGAYTLYALAGAQDSKYLLPDWESATLQSQVFLAGNLHDELEAGSATVELLPDTHHQIDLKVRRVVAGLNASLSELPTGITDVKLSIQPLATSLAIDGTFFTNDTEKDKAVASLQLTKGKLEGTWYLADTAFIFPSSDNVTISIRLDGKDGVKEYSYETESPFEANYSYDLIVTYDDMIGMSILSGYVSGTEWDGGKQVIFGLNNQGQTDARRFKSGDVFKGSYILKTEPADKETEAWLYLLHHKQYKFIKPTGTGSWIITPPEVFTAINEEFAKIIHEASQQELDRIHEVLSATDGSYILNTQDVFFFVNSDNSVTKSFRLTTPTFQTGVPAAKDTLKLRGYNKVKVTYK
jgi:hypothetical protein